MKLTSRRRARECALQALYSWQISHNDITNIEIEFIKEWDMKNVDIMYFKELCSGSVQNIMELDEAMTPFLSRPLNELGHIERAVLRIAIFELIRQQDVPYKVAINEAIELGKKFGAQDSYKFINGVLDKVVLKIRPNRN